MHYLIYLLLDKCLILESNYFDILSLLDLLRPKSGFQIHYQSIVCIWTMSFMPYIANKMIKHNPVAYLADVLKGVQKDKVIRIVLATFRVILFCFMCCVTKTLTSDKHKVK